MPMYLNAKVIFEFTRWSRDDNRPHRRCASACGFYRGSAAALRLPPQRLRLLRRPQLRPLPAAAPTWSVGPMDLSGFIDGYYSFNFNRPNTTDGFDQLNQLYNFNDKTDQFELSAAKLTLNHAPDPVGADIDFIYGRTNDLINNSASNTTTTTFVASQLPYLEQAFLSLKPAKAKGFELDFGKWVTSAGAEVIESITTGTIRARCCS